MQKINFNERYELTTAVIERLKTNTRRLEKELERLVANYEKHYEEPLRVVEQRWDKTNDCLLIYAHTGIADTDREHVLSLKTRYKLGEVVAVAQNYNDALEEYNKMGDKTGWGALVGSVENGCAGYYNKMFVDPDLMPHQIKMTNVRIERLQDITDKDCLKEGVLRREIRPFRTIEIKYQVPNTVILKDTPREAFAALIDRPGVGRKGLWESNPWVVVYTFKLIK